MASMRGPNKDVRVSSIVCEVEDWRLRSEDKADNVDITICTFSHQSYEHQLITILPWQYTLDSVSTGYD